VLETAVPVLCLKIGIMKSGRPPILVPFKLKRKDFIWLIVLALILLIIALNTKDASAQTLAFDKVDFVTYQKDSTFSIKVPDYLVEVHDLSPEAALQFKNNFTETYLMVVPERKSNGAHQSLQQLEEHFKFNLTVGGGVFIHSSPVEINRRNAFQGEAELATDDGVPLVYLVTFIETSDMLYKIYGWTLASQREFLEDFRKAANSFVVANGVQSRL
jgi:hypothetical protein